MPCPKNIVLESAMEDQKVFLEIFPHLNECDKCRKKYAKLIVSIEKNRKNTRLKELRDGKNQRFHSFKRR